MCGIAIVVSGIRLELSISVPDYVPPSPQSSEQVLFSIDDIKAALSRRGPDSTGSKSVSVNFKKLSFEEAEHRDLVSSEHETVVLLQFIGATLQLRGIAPVVQPLEDSSGNVLVYNGEIFGGVHVGNDCNDSEILMQLLGQCNLCVSHDHGSGEDGVATVPQLLSRIKGPWALIYWQNSSKTLWFGRDAFGRRSLLVHWPSQQDSRLLLTSVSPLSSEYEMSDSKDSEKLSYWEELPCGICSISFGSSSPVGELKRHKWTDEYLDELVDWERKAIQPEAGELCIFPENGSAPSEASLRVLASLKEAVMRRTVLNAAIQSVSSCNGNGGDAPVAVLFSGGLDSMILSALLDQCLDPKYEIDLLNVSFDGQCAPDRISSRAGLEELKTIAPSRRWKLVEIDADLMKLTSELKQVVSLISPAKTYMDLNIGIALWLAAGGEGWIYGGSDDSQPVKYKSEARVLLTGTGADEQCAGYGRYKTKYRNGSWLALHEEMKLDMQRIWKRNLGRDDRCIADNGKEARFPFLDEDVIRTLLDIPLWELADLDQPSGVGDKKILREVARMLGLSGVAGLPKRAIQFGTRVARESNRINFGSNRAANQASAGSVEIYKASC